jgi:hypothetical protein
MSGKGSNPRPFSVSQDQFASNWEATFGKKKREPSDEEISAYDNERLVTRYDKISTDHTPAAHDTTTAR